MTKPGHIRIGIDWKVYFEYYEFPKPNKLNYPFAIFRREHYLTRISYTKAMEKYEASKRLIEVNNVERHGNLYLIGIKEGKYIGVALNNQLCKAEVGKTATIVELN